MRPASSPAPSTQRTTHSPWRLSRVPPLRSSLHPAHRLRWRQALAPALQVGDDASSPSSDCPQASSPPFGSKGTSQRAGATSRSRAQRHPGVFSRSSHGAAREGGATRGGATQGCGGANDQTVITRVVGATRLTTLDAQGNTLSAKVACSKTLVEFTQFARNPGPIGGDSPRSSPPRWSHCGLPVCA